MTSDKKKQAPPFIHHPEYDAPLPAGHRFPMSKFRSLRKYLENEGIAAADGFVTGENISRAHLELVHAPEYIDAFLENRLDEKAMRRIGLPWSEELARRSQIAVGGTLMTTRMALEHGLACNTAGGTHHAFPDFGSGFCIFNDLAVSARVVLNEGAVKRVLIVDLDVHQGDGTAFIFAGEERVFTFSMHCEANFPVAKQKSNLDIGLDKGTGDEEYLAVLGRELPRLLDEFEPELVLYDAGVDVHQDDLLGRLSLTDEGISRRDYYVLSECRRRNIPTACVIGGGYAEDRDQLTRLHALLHRAAIRVFQDLSTDSG